MALIPPRLHGPAIPDGGDGAPISGEASVEEQARILCRTAFGGLMLVGDDRRYLRVNEGAAELLGAPRDVVLVSRIDDFTAPEHLTELELFWAALERDGERAGRGIVMRYDGAEAVVEYRAHWSFSRGCHLFALRDVGLPPMPRMASAGEATSPLTRREQEVLQLAAEGRSTEAIAALLVLSPGTVKTHFHHIYGKLGAPDRVSAVATAMRLGLIS
jgi:DNA-binding CsgD family transcriptional regulator